MPPQLDCRPFELSDLDRVLEIEQASFGRDAWDRELFLEYSRCCPQLFLVARRRRRIAGYSITCTGAGGAELVSIAVDPPDRRKAVGRVLMDATAAKLRSRRIGSWWLMVSTTNDSAIHFYQTYGFVRTRRSPNYYGARRDAWRMRLSL